jgi:hypothetical protein
MNVKLQKERGVKIHKQVFIKLREERAVKLHEMDVKLHGKMAVYRRESRCQVTSRNGCKVTTNVYTVLVF